MDCRAGTHGKMMHCFLPRVDARQAVGRCLTSTGYGPSKAAASRLGASRGSPGSPGVTVVVVAAVAVGMGEACGEGVRGRDPSVSLSSSRAMVGEAAVSRETAWSCLASVMSTPLICRDTLGSERVGRVDRRHWAGPPALTHREDSVPDL
jgi:hypothetical protein